jgi:hypothetical protein
MRIWFATAVLAPCLQTPLVLIVVLEGRVVVDDAVGCGILGHPSYAFLDLVLLGHGKSGPC